jgi:hypothetical protein
MKVSGFPFVVEVLGDVAGGMPAILRIQLDSEPTDAGFDRLRCVVVWFGELVEAGGFGATHAKPTFTLPSDGEPIGPCLA